MLIFRQLWQRTNSWLSIWQDRHELMCFCHLSVGHFPCCEYFSCPANCITIFQKSFVFLSLHLTSSSSDVLPLFSKLCLHCYSIPYTFSSRPSYLIFVPFAAACIFCSWSFVSLHPSTAEIWHASVLSFLSSAALLYLLVFNKLAFRSLIIIFMTFFLLLHILSSCLSKTE